MYKLFLRKSYLLFLLLCCSFFSCERILELIKPTEPTKPTPICKIKSEDGKEFVYDAKGKLLYISNYGYSSSVPTPLEFEYNEKDQIVRSTLQDSRAYIVKTYDYDLQGRLKHIYIEPDADAFDYTTTFTYKTDTIFIESIRKFKYEEQQVYIDRQVTLYFKDGNLIRAYHKYIRPDHQDVEYDRVYTYTNTLNKISDIQKQVSFLTSDFNNPLISKNLPSAIVAPSDESKGYSWIVNEKGYPVNNGLDNRLVYDYECIN